MGRGTIKRIWIGVLCVVGFFLRFGITNHLEEEEIIKTVTLRAPHIKREFNDSYICTALPIDQTYELYSVAYDPLASMKVVHHMSLIGCEEPGSYESYWNCRSMPNSTSQYQYKPVCARGKALGLVYLWVNDAPKFELPKDIGFEIGGKSKIHYLVMQLHYLVADTENTDNTGMRISYVQKPRPKTATILQLNTRGKIPAKSEARFEAVCKMENEVPLHPFAFQVHTHSLGQVVSGYKVTPGKPYEEWTLVGKKNPQLPQFYYPVANEDIVFKKGDYLATRCTFYNHHNHTVRTGHGASDEMCIYYLMFWTNTTDFKHLRCKPSFGPPAYYWYMNDFVNIPHEDASSLSSDEPEADPNSIQISF